MRYNNLHTEITTVELWNGQRVAAYAVFHRNELIGHVRSRPCTVDGLGGRTLQTPAWFYLRNDLETWKGPFLTLQRVAQELASVKQREELDEHQSEQERFDTELVALVGKLNAESLLIIPGVYEILAEEFNNEILSRMGYEG